MCATLDTKDKTCLDFRLELARRLIRNFSSRKPLITSPAPQGQETAQEFTGHFIENSVGQKKQSVECKLPSRKTLKGYPNETWSRCRQCQLLIHVVHVLLKIMLGELWISGSQLLCNFFPCLFFYDLTSFGCKRKFLWAFYEGQPMIILTVSWWQIWKVWKHFLKLMYFDLHLSCNLL